jgi:dihydroorotase
VGEVAMASLLIKNGHVLSPEDNLDAELDVLVEDETIRQIAPGLTASADETIDARGQIVAPGFVDLHCHLREPGGEMSETLETGLAAAVAGGFTAVCAMPNTRPVNDHPEATRSLIEKARSLGLARVFPMAAVSPGSQGESLADFEALVAAGAVGFTDDGRPVKTAELMQQALARALGLGVPIADHCENPSLSAGGVMNAGPVCERLGLRGIPARSEEACVARDLALAEETGGLLHVQHLSTAGALAMVRAAKRRGVRVTCEVTPHHFTLTDEATAQYGTNAKMNPPLRNARDVETLVAGIADGTVDALATDHAPHAPELKQKPMAEAPFGIIGLETALALALTQLVHPGKISLARLVLLMSTNPARIIRRPLGRLAVGAAADITILDPNLEWTYHVAAGRSKSRNSPFDGWPFKGAAIATIVAGKIVYRRAA